MKITLRNGTEVDVPDPRESPHARRSRELKEKYGYWVTEYVDGVPVAMRWHHPIFDHHPAEGTAEAPNGE